LVYNGNGGFTYTADGEASGADSFEYTLIDNDGTTSTATVFLTVDPALPTLFVDETIGQQPDPKDTVSDRVSSADFSSVFTSVAGATYGLSLVDASGAAVVAGVGIGSGVFAVETNGFGAGQEILLYNTVNGIEGRITNPIDGSGGDDWVYLTISVTEAGVVTLNQNLALGNGDYPLSIFHPDGADFGDVVSLDGTGIYGIDLIQTAGDGAVDSVDLAAGQAVFVFADAAPIAQNDYEDNPLAVVAGNSVELNIFADSGAGGDSPGADSMSDLTSLGVNIDVTTGPSQGTLVYNGNGGFTYTADGEASGADSFEYTLIDNDGTTSTATVFLTVEEAVTVQSLNVNSPDSAADTLVAIDGQADVFAWSLGDRTSDGDVIVGFNSDEDAIDIGDLLVGLDATDLSQFVDVGLADNGASTVLKFSSSGDFNSADQVITLQGVDLFADVDLGGPSALNAALQNLVEAGKLITE
jgi:hypothetical protein